MLRQRPAPAAATRALTTAPVVAVSRSSSRRPLASPKLRHPTHTTAPSSLAGSDASTSSSPPTNQPTPDPKPKPQTPRTPMSAVPLAPGASEKAVSFRNQQGENLQGIFTDTGSQICVILCHGYASSSASTLLVQLASELAKCGTSTLRFDFSGNGSSEGTFAFANYMKEVQDLRCGVEYVRQQLQREVQAVLGHSKGGNVVLLYGGQYDDVPRIVNIAARYDMKGGVAARFGAETLARVQEQGGAEVEQLKRDETGAYVSMKFMLMKKDLDERMSLDMDQAVRNIRSSEVLTVHGTADAVIPVQDAQAFASVISRHSLVLVDGGDHNFRAAAHSAAAVQAVTQFLQRPKE